MQTLLEREGFEMRLSAPIFRLKRQAKQLTRQSGIPWHKALDQIARQEGFRNWSHLASSQSGRSPARHLAEQLTAGDLVLLGARPGHGKTMLGLELAVQAARSGHRAFFFSLESNQKDVSDQLGALGVDVESIKHKLTIDTSNDICAEYIIGCLGNAEADRFIVIDYLQVLDQQRRHPELNDQVRDLKAFAERSGAIIVAISQIDRSFNSARKRLPELSDVRLPNPLDLSLFTKAVFLHEGEVQLQAVA